MIGGLGVQAEDDRHGQCRIPIRARSNSTTFGRLGDDFGAASSPGRLRIYSWLAASRPQPPSFPVRPVWTGGDRRGLWMRDDDDSARADRRTGRNVQDLAPTTTGYLSRRTGSSPRTSANQTHGADLCVRSGWSFDASCASRIPSHLPSRRYRCRWRRPRNRLGCLDTVVGRSRQSSGSALSRKLRMSTKGQF